MKTITIILFISQRINKTKAHRRRPRNERITVTTGSGSSGHRLETRVPREQRVRFILQFATARFQHLGLSAPTACHHRTTQIQYATLPTLRKELSQHAGKSRREGTLICSSWTEDVGWRTTHSHAVSDLLEWKKREVH